MRQMGDIEDGFGRRVLAHEDVSAGFSKTGCEVNMPARLRRWPSGQRAIAGLGAVQNRSVQKPFSTKSSWYDFAWRSIETLPNKTCRVLNRKASCF
jgi:hypothetical protein